MLVVFIQFFYLFGKYIYNKHAIANYFLKSKKLTSNSEESSSNKTNFESIQMTPDDYENENIYSSKSNIRFSPPAYIQRYTAVCDVISDTKYNGKIQKVVDFGCSELGFLNYLKNTRGIEEILCVDVDRDILDMHKYKIRPLTADYLHCRKTPLSIKILEGSITDPDEVLLNTDAVICIELIEHLYPDTLANLPANIFGFIKPQVAIITTPNAEFNVLFGRMEGFRHWDHKFEWTRKEFEDWANNIIKKYPEYEVTFDGIGAGPSGSEHLGKCSQMAIFNRTKLPIYQSPGIKDIYKVVAYENYPVLVDNRPDEVKIFQEAEYYIRQYSINTDQEEMSLEILANRITDIQVTIETLKDVLENSGMTITNHEEKGLCVVCPALSTFSSYHSENLYDDGNNFDDNHDDWGDEPGPPINYQWPEIHDQDNENWEMDYEDYSSQINNSFDHVSSPSSISIANINATVDDDNSFDNVSSPSSISIARDNVADFIVNDDNNGYELNNNLNNSSLDVNIDGIDFRLVQTFDESNIPSMDFSLEISSCLDGSADSKHVENIQERDELPVSSTLNNYQDDKEHDNSDIISKSAQLDETNDSIDLNLSHEIISDEFRCRDLKSMCSMYLESSSFNNSQICPDDLTNPDFECSKLLNDSITASDVSQLDDNDILTSSCNVPKETSTPHNKSDTSEKVERNMLVSESDISNDFYSCDNSTDSDVACQTSKKLSSRRILLSQESRKSSNNTSVSIDSLDEFMLSMNSVFDQSNEKYEASKLKLTIDKSQDYEKPVDNEKVRMSPPSSWSSGIIDSGYPTSSSAQDMTPENDLPSIAHDAESSSVDNPQSLMIEVTENTNVANDSCDYQGNNMIAEQDNNETKNIQSFKKFKKDIHDETDGDDGKSQVVIKGNSFASEI
ncbi:protein PFC0760c [Aphidius gifuensis]|uniref:protein PFC0760c n=1 Tax=Aphidius gifuensis TaxID=684658 RepID=UPI001CDC6108|nr:protein PFC0760c [Aphidius gifuensis]